MTEDEVTRFVDRIEKTIISSHSSLTKTYSDLQNDTNNKLEKLHDSMLGIHKRQDIANGRMAEAEIEIQGLHENEIRFAERLESHLKYEENKDKEEKDGKKYWTRNFGWWFFMLVSGTFLWMVGKANGL